MRARDSTTLSPWCLVGGWGVAVRGRSPGCTALSVVRCYHRRSTSLSQRAGSVEARGSQSSMAPYVSPLTPVWMARGVPATEGRSSAEVLRAPLSSLCEARYRLSFLRTPAISGLSKVDRYLRGSCPYSARGARFGLSTAPRLSLLG